MEQNERNEIIRDTVMNLCWWLIGCAGTAAGVLIICIGSRKTGAHTGSGLLPSEIVEMCPAAAVIGFLLAAAAFTAVWFCGLRQSLMRCRGHHPLRAVLWGLLWILGTALLLYTTFMVFLWRLGLFVSPKPDWVILLLLILPALPVLFLAGYLLKKLVRHLSAASETD